MASYVPVVAIHPLRVSCANRHHTPNPQRGATQPTQDGDSQATSNPLEYLMALRRERSRTFDNHHDQSQRQAPFSAQRSSLHQAI
jgi:hypothetical protein